MLVGAFLRDNMNNILYKALFLSLLICSVACTPAMQSVKDSASLEQEYPWDSCSYEIGDHACNFTLKDQHDKEVSLYDFYGDVIVVDFSTMWCGPCKMAASEVQGVKEAFSNIGIAYLTILIENTEGYDPNLADCNDWANIHGITEPVLAGDRSLVDPDGIHGWPITGWPTFFFITEDMVIDSALRGFSSAYVEALILDAAEEGS